MSEEINERLRSILARVLEPKVLVVEDDEDDILLLQLEFTGKKVSLTVARTAEEAIKAATDTRFDLCILDLGLPDSVNPTELVSSIQAVSPPMPIAVLTGSLTDPSLKRILEQKVVAVMLKPLRREVVAEMLGQ